MFGPCAFMLLSSRFWKKLKDIDHKHHSIEASKDNMHVKFLQISALLLQLFVETTVAPVVSTETTVDALITQMKWLNEALTTQKFHRNHIETIEQSKDEPVLELLLNIAHADLEISSTC